MVRFVLDDEVTEDHAADVWPVYESVFGDYPDYETWRKAVWNAHRSRRGFRLVRATDGGALLGFAYGYTGDRGQWWTDNAGEVMNPEVAEAWLGGHFELVSIGVVAAARGRGIGRELMHRLMDGLPHDRLLLMTTSHSRDPARRLYDSGGWHLLGPGIGDGTVIMGRRTRESPTA